MLMLLSVNVSAEILTDGSDDIWYSKYNTEEKEWPWLSKNVTGHSNIDITSIEYLLETSELTLTMILKEEINESRSTGYEIYYGNFSDLPYYRAQYLSYTGEGTYRSVGLDDDIHGELIYPVSEDGKIFSATFEVPYIDSTFEIWGYAFEYSDDNMEYWADFVPLKYEPENISEDADDVDNGEDDVNETDDSSDDTGDGDDDVNETDDSSDDNESVDNGDNESLDSNGDKDTPGFEIIIMVCAISLVLFKRWKFK